MTSRKSDDNGKVSSTFSKLGGAPNEISVIYLRQFANKRSRSIQIIETAVHSEVARKVTKGNSQNIRKIPK